MEKNLLAQKAKSDIMAGMPPEPGSFEAEFQSFIDKHYPPLSPTDLIQEAKRRLMAEAGRVQPGSFEAKFQEFADRKFPVIGRPRWTFPQSDRNFDYQPGLLSDVTSQDMRAEEEYLRAQLPQQFTASETLPGGDENESRRKLQEVGLISGYQELPDEVIDASVHSPRQA